ncbi:hypothetical protein [Inquilinus sp.]|uniref:hypothetical protein n=1 Tax=Inquilinus sp. TaxID=1932117 RepID=UPI0031D5DA28
MALRAGAGTTGLGCPCNGEAAGSRSTGGRPAGRRSPARRQAEGPAQAGDQDPDRQGGVGEVDVDALVLGQPLPEIDGHLTLAVDIDVWGGVDGAGDALGDGLAPVVFLILPVLPPDVGLAPHLLPLLPQLGLERYSPADAEEQAAEADLGRRGAVEIVGRDAQGLEAARQLQRALDQLGQHRSLVGVGRFLLLPAQLGLERDDAADAEKQAAEPGLGLAGAVEIAGRQGGGSAGLEGPGHFQGELRQPGQHLDLPGSLIRGRRSGGRSFGCDGIGHPLNRTNREQRVKGNCPAITWHHKSPKAG